MNPATERYLQTIYPDRFLDPRLLSLLKGLSIKDFSSQLPFIRKLTQYERKAPNFKKLLYTIHLLIFLIVMNIDTSFMNRHDGSSKQVYIESAKKVLNTVNLRTNPLIIFIESSINNFDTKSTRSGGPHLPNGWTAVPAVDQRGDHYTLYQHQDGRQTETHPAEQAIDLAIKRGALREQSTPKALRSPTEIKIDDFIDTFSRFGFPQLGGNYNYNYIHHPKTGKKFTINSKQGIKILNQFIKNIK